MGSQRLRRRVSWCSLVAGTLAVLALSTGAGAAGSESSAVNGKTRGVPAGGPSVLYEPPPAAPQLQNRDPLFRAPYEMVSGTERYVDGEYLYTDFLYDDEDTTYPDDPGRYANNAADLVEYRMSVRGDGLAVRLSLTTLLVPDSTIAVVAFDTDRNPETGSDMLPRHPGLPFPGTDQVLTTWGTGAEWSTWNGAGWDTVPLDVVAALEANQITVTVPKKVASPTGQWSATLATGLYDRSTGGWLPVESTHGSDIVNLGFRFDEMEPRPFALDAASAQPYQHQRTALTAATPTAYARVLDFDLLRARGERDNVPTHGLMYRMYASRLEKVDVVIESTPRTYERTPASEGKNRDSMGAQYLSRLQPYAVYVPASYDASDPAPLTLALHGLGVEYFWLNEGPYLTKQLGADRNSIVLAPSARGQGGFYIGEMEYDVFEAWNDVARHYALDPARTAITGWSMGGYGAYRLGLLYPHLFSRAVPVIPAGMKGIWIPGVTDDETVVNRWLDNARNLPIFHIADTASELTFYPGQLQNAAGPAVGGFQSLDSLGYRYKLWSVAIDHLIIGTNFPEITEFLADHEIEPEPFHVTYARQPSNDAPALGLVHNRAYWLSGIELRDGSTPLAKGVVDVVSLGFGKSDATSSVNRRPGVTAGGYPYVEQERVWAKPGTVPVENRLVIKATNIAAITIDPVTARVDCDAELDVTSDGPLEVNLLGCERSVRTKT